MSKVYLKKNTEEMAKYFADMKTQLLGINPEDKNYQKYYNKFFKNFCEEALFHSMTPSGELRSNPIAGAVKGEFSLDNIVDKHFKGSSQKTKILKHQIDAAIQSLTSAFMQIRFGTQPKSTQDKKSDLVYKSGDADEMLEVELNRYFSYMVAGLLYGYIDKFFNQKAVENSFPQIFEEMLPKDVNGEVSLRSLRSKANRKKFAKTFFETGKNVIK